MTYNGGAVLAGIALYLKQIKRSHQKVIGVILQGTKRPESSLCETINSSLVDEVVMVTTREAELAQIELTDNEEIAEFNAAIAYAGCKKLDLRNSLVVLGGGNVPIYDLQ